MIPKFCRLIIYGYLSHKKCFTEISKLSKLERTLLLQVKIEKQLQNDKLCIYFPKNEIIQMINLDYLFNFSNQYKFSLKQFTKDVSIIKLENFQNFIRAMPSSVKEKQLIFSAYFQSDFIYEEIRKWENLNNCQLNNLKLNIILGQPLMTMQLLNQCNMQKVNLRFCNIGNDKLLIPYCQDTREYYYNSQRQIANNITKTLNFIYCRVHDDQIFRYFLKVNKIVMKNSSFSQDALLNLQKMESLEYLNISNDIESDFMKKSERSGFEINLLSKINFSQQNFISLKKLKLSVQNVQELEILLQRIKLQSLKQLTIYINKEIYLNKISKYLPRSFSLKVYANQVALYQIQNNEYELLDQEINQDFQKASEKFRLQQGISISETIKIQKRKFIREYELRSRNYEIIHSIIVIEDDHNKSRVETYST